MAIGACVAAEAVTLSITNFTMVGGKPQLLIQSDIGITNQIQCNTNLYQADWVVLTNLVVAQSPYGYVDASAPPALMRYYRVAVAVPTGMVLIPSGSFEMGDRLDGEPDAIPVHTVYVSAFYMETNLVSYSFWTYVFQWATDHGYDFDYPGSGKADNHPVHTIDWYDCLKWCNARSEMEGLTPAYYTDGTQTLAYRYDDLDLTNLCVNWNAGYRLPTEAEWEKAARGGLRPQRFPWGYTIDWSHANYKAMPGLYSYDLNWATGYDPSWDDGVEPYTSPVGHFPPNGYGLYDMAGNLLERCWDWQSDYYSSGPERDPRGPD